MRSSSASPAPRAGGTPQSWGHVPRRWREPYGSLGAPGTARMCWRTCFRPSRSSESGSAAARMSETSSRGCCGPAAEECLGLGLPPLGGGAGLGLPEGWNGHGEVLPAAWLPGQGSGTVEGCAAQGAALGWGGEEDAAGLPGRWVWVCPYCFPVVGRTSLCDHPVPPWHGSLRAPVLFAAWLWMCVSGLRAVKIKCSGLLRGPQRFARFIPGVPRTPGKGTVTSTPHGHVLGSGSCSLYPPAPSPLAFSRLDPSICLPLFHFSPAIATVNWDM